MTNDTYLYPYPSAEARERDELPLWRESHKANIACRLYSLSSSHSSAAELMQ